MIQNQKLKKLKYYTNYFFRAKKVFRWPKKSDVLIFDSVNQHVLMEYFGDWKPEVLHVRGEQINILVLLASLFRVGSKEDAYKDCYVEKVNPRLVITFIDNNMSFHTISKRHPNIKTMFIQNGIRGYFGQVFENLDKVDSSLQHQLAVDYMMTFGSGVGGEYSKSISGSVFPIGSIKNNQISHLEKSIQKDTIAFISQWQDHGVQIGDTFYDHETYFGQIDRLIFKTLNEYAKSKNKRIMIISRHPSTTPKRKEEADYFAKLLNRSPEFLEPAGLNSSYQAIDTAEVVVAIDSTLGYESLARGNKTAIFSIRGSFVKFSGETFGWPGKFADEGPFWTNIPNTQSFERILDHLFNVDELNWRKDIEASHFSSIMAYDQGNTILKSILEKELGKKS
ncbi:MAG: hypothetical protein PHY93_13980 [Bacteriovorax sp.]|nr:hypothetical protein [Bacteriovorax sp.]